MRGVRGICEAHCNIFSSGNDNTQQSGIQHTAFNDMSTHTSAILIKLLTLVVVAILSLSRRDQRLRYGFRHIWLCSVIFLIAAVNGHTPKTHLTNVCSVLHAS